MKSGLSHADKKTIVAELVAGKATMTELAKRYGVSIPAISNTFRRMTGTAFRNRTRFIKGNKYIDWHGNILEFDMVNPIGVYIFLDHEHKRVRYFGGLHEPHTELKKLSSYTQTLQSAKLVSMV